MNVQFISFVFIVILFMGAGCNKSTQKDNVVKNVKPTTVAMQENTPVITNTPATPKPTTQPVPPTTTKVDEPGSNINVLSKDTSQRISGIHNGLSTSLVFSSIQSSPYERKAWFKNEDGSIVVSIVTNDETGVNKITVNNISWEFNTSQKTSTLTEKEKDALRVFGKSEAARAIVETAAYLYWKAPGSQLIIYRITFVQLYQALAEFYPVENKKLVQPARSLSGECKNLENMCQLITEETIFGCLGNNEVEDVIVLIDGLPGCSVQ